MLYIILTILTNISEDTYIYLYIHETDLNKKQGVTSHLRMRPKNLGENLGVGGGLLFILTTLRMFLLIFPLSLCPVVGFGLKFLTNIQVKSFR